MKGRQVVYLAFFMFGLLQIACGLGALPVVTRDKPAPSKIPVTIVQMPEIMRRGETAYFSIKTDPKNTCGGDIEYSDETGNRAAMNLPEYEADETGICTWFWTAPLKASKGTAWFSPSASTQEDTHMPVPSAFCIEQCPY